MSQILNPKIDYLKEKIAVLPSDPGVYQYFNKDGKIIYVGKAKNLKKRVSSYFVGKPDNGKTALLVRNIANIEHIVVNSEEDALLLENNLIKKYQPRYNVLLKDDKSFPWIVVKNESFPRVFSTRNVIKDGSLYFGPYTSVGMVRTLLDLFKSTYPLRNCKLNLSQENIAQGKYKVCLEYHIGNCKGPCIGKYDEEIYRENIESIKNILRGNINSVIKYLKEMMHSYASEYKFEEAEEVKQKIKQLNSYQSKSTIVSASINNVDVYSIIEDENSAYVNFLKVVNGSIIQAHTIEMKKRLNESLPELLSLAITEIRERLHSNSRELIVPFKPDTAFENVRFIIPQKGEKRQLLELSERNVKYYRLEKLKQQSIHKKETREDRILKTMQKDLRLKEKPMHIECFDNSNIQGNFPVAACVVFKNAKPSKKDYRHFNVKTVVGPDDFASMEEIIERRYKRLINENESLPNLVIIDGGKGQLGAAMKIFRKLEIDDKVAVIGIAKRLEEIFFPGDPVPLYLDKNTETLKVIQHARNEAHRFGITFHRNQRSKNFVASELDQINGIGEKTAQKLLAEFKSVEQIKKLGLDQIQGVIGMAKGKVVWDYFH
ncbi:excinuclease ABC subunit UvrC [Plebeiibacterium sediminum]|uniref:UvrABC system protein C n=1 Tax=Plebeiibacterium sediminum TaxID=2992112 RepID=A0AAE3M1G8_9BACT|nr:excinuclease ABC subunit UvrC [Plebeiobacterium sediminum]MCW3785181.1 excinuclease ABC subunit UvrC [Plebeiobacterium sediminum]